MLYVEIICQILIQSLLIPRNDDVVYFHFRRFQIKQKRYFPSLQEIQLQKRKLDQQYKAQHFAIQDF